VADLYTFPMLRKLFLLLFLTFSLSSFGQFQHSGEPYKGLQAARDSLGKFWILNKHDVVVIQVDSLALNVQQIQEKIDASSVHPMEKQLIRRMIETVPSEQNKKMGIWKLSFNSLLLQPIVMEASYDALLSTYGKRKLKKMIRRKK
jgi:hypothetical protein